MIWMGLRKVPDNVPNRDLLAEHLGKALTQVPDPFGTHASFGEHNNARLCAFLDSFGFEYEFFQPRNVINQAVLTLPFKPFWKTMTAS
jgi:lysyl-tRNA synthetase class I